MWLEVALLAALSAVIPDQAVDPSDEQLKVNALFGFACVMKPCLSSSCTQACTCRQPAPLGEAPSLRDRLPPRRRVPTYAPCRLTRVSPPAAGNCSDLPRRPSPATATLVLSLPTATHRAYLCLHPATG